MSGGARVVRLRIAPVKGMALLERAFIDAARGGVAGDRRFILLGADGRHRSGLAHGPLVRIVPDYDAADERLTLRFPDGSVVEGDATTSEKLVGIPWEGAHLHVRPVPGFDEALSAFAGQPLRLARVEADARPASSDVTILSVASVEAIERAANLPDRLDDRRFRMLVTIDGVPAFEEDRWVGREVAVGDAIVRVEVPTARCATTTRDPATGLRDIDILRLLADIRGVSPRQTVDLGVYTQVVQAGRIAVGDAVRVLDEGELAA